MVSLAKVMFHQPALPKQFWDMQALLQKLSSVFSYNDGFH